MSNRTFALSTVAMLPSGAIATLALVEVPRFKSLFDSFGAELPVATQVLLATYQWWWVLTLVAGVACWAYRTRPDALTAIAVIGCTMSFLLFAFGIYACYGTLFRLAATV